jgi:hypothetical protein
LYRHQLNRRLLRRCQLFCRYGFMDRNTDCHQTTQSRSSIATFPIATGTSSCLTLNNIKADCLGLLFARISAHATKSATPHAAANCCERIPSTCTTSTL